MHRERARCTEVGTIGIQCFLSVLIKSNLLLLFVLVFGPVRTRSGHCNASRYTVDSFFFFI